MFGQGINESPYEKNKRLEKQLECYRNYLADDLGYIQPYFHPGGLELFEERYKNINLSASVTIGDDFYDITESKPNKLAIENYSLKQEVLRSRMAIFLLREMIIRFEGRDEKNNRNLRKEWDKLAKEIGIEKTVSFFDVVDGLASFDGEGDEEILIRDFGEYLKHESCEGLTCSISGDDDYCLSLRKRFGKRQLRRDFEYMGFSKKKTEALLK